MYNNVARMHACKPCYILGKILVLIYSRYCRFLLVSPSWYWQLVSHEVKHSDLVIGGTVASGFAFIG